MPTRKKSGWKDDPLAGTGVSKKPAVNVIVRDIPILSAVDESRRQSDLLLIQRISDLVNSAGTATEETHPGAAFTELYADQHTQFWREIRRFVCPVEYILPQEGRGECEYTVWRCESMNAFKRYFHQLRVIIPTNGMVTPTIISTDRREMDDTYEKKKLIHAKTTVYELAEVFVSAVNAEYRRNQ